jgi:PAS domain S-box-containing protein
MSFESPAESVSVAPERADEVERLRALLATELLDSPPEFAFDQLTELAATVCQAPIALFSLVDVDRQWFKSRVGLDACETPREQAFCAHAIAQDQLMEVSDALEDPRFADNPLVTGEPGIRFYAGIPICTSQGFPLGTLCVIDTVPRRLQPGQIEQLRRLARLCAALVESHRERLAAERRERTLAHLLDVMPEGVVVCNQVGQLNLFNAAARDWHGTDPLAIPQSDWAQHLQLYAVDGARLLEPEEIPLVRAWQGERIDNIEMCILSLKHAPRWVLCSGGPVRTPNGDNDGAVVVMRDITVRRSAMEQLEIERQRLEMVVSGTRAGTWEWNVQTGETRFNERWAEIVGYSLQELEPISVHTWQGLMHPEDLQTSQAMLQEHFRGERDHYELACRMRHKAGHWIWVQVRGRVQSWSGPGHALWMAGTHLEVSAMKAAEEASERARVQLQSIVDASEDVSIIATDPEGVITVFNSGAERLLGYRAAELCGLHTPTLFHDPKEVEIRGRELSRERGRTIAGFEIFIDAARQGRAETRQWTYVRRDGQRRQVRLSVNAMRTRADAELLGFIGIAIDITALVDATAARSESEARFRGAFEGSALGLALVSPEGAFIQVNPALCEMLGFDQAELLKKDFKSLTHPDDVGIDADLVRQMLAGRLPSYQLRKRYISKHGALVWALLAVSLVRDEAGQPRYFVSQVQDITTRVRAEAALRASEAKLSELFRLSPVGIALNRLEDGMFVEANPEFYRMLGYSEQAFRKLTYWDITPIEFEREEALQLEKLRSVGRYGPYEKEYIQASGRRVPVLLNGVRFEPSGAETLILSVVQDISERKRLEQMKSEFVSTVSHELRTPLTSISGALDLVCGGALGEPPHAMAEMLDLAHRNARRLNVLIGDLLDLEKLVAGKMSLNRSPHSLHALLVDAVGSLQGYAEKHAVKLLLHPGLPMELMVDAGRFCQVLANLVSNAIKFSPKFGVVEIEAAALAADVEIRVLDRGPGVVDDFLPRLFESFAQADAETSGHRDGTGLGLAISRQLTERMGGRIGYAPRALGGSCFWLQFPLLASAAAPFALIAPTAPTEQAERSVDLAQITQPARPLQVLIVEDDPDVATVFGAMLSRAGFATRHASSIKEAQAELAEHRFDALTLDLGLGEEDGSSLLKELRLNPATAELPVLLVSGHPDLAQASMDPTDSHTSLLAKPLNPIALAQSLRLLMAPDSPPERTRILHVEDDFDDAQRLHGGLSQLGEVWTAGSLQAARDMLSRSDFDLIVLDLILPDGDGLELLENAAKPLPPIIVHSKRRLSPDRALHLAAVLPKGLGGSSRVTEVARLILATEQFDSGPNDSSPDAHRPDARKPDAPGAKGA